MALGRKRGLEFVEIVFLGDGPERRQLQAQAEALGINATFVGAIYDEQQISRYLSEAEVTVSPGKVGLTAMHSLMYGTPVISHDDFEVQMPEVEAIVPGFTGEFFKAGDPDSLAEILMSFRKRYPDRALTRSNCYLMIDTIYNPEKQADVMRMACEGQPAQTGDNAFRLFPDIKL